MFRGKFISLKQLCKNRMDEHQWFVYWSQESKEVEHKKLQREENNKL